MVDFSVLSNITTLVINNSLINNTEEFIPNAINNANTVSEGYYGLGILLVIFIFFLVTIFKDNGDIRMDIARSLLISGALTGAIGLLLLYTTIIVSFQHVGWFLLIWFICLISIYLLKKKGQ